MWSYHLVSLSCTALYYCVNLLLLLQDSDVNMFDFEIVAGSEDHYAAIAFGLDYVMQDADLYYCTQNQFFSGVIRDKEKPPVVSDSIPVSSYVHSLASYRVENGIIFMSSLCQWFLNLSASIMQVCTEPFVKIKNSA